MSNLNVTCAAFIFMAVCKIYNGDWRRCMWCVCVVVSFCVWDVTQCYGSMLLNVSPCWGEECPEHAVNVPRGEPACWYTHLFLWMCMLCFHIYSSCVLSLRRCVHVFVCVSVSGCVCIHRQVCKKLDQVRVACVLFVTMVTVSGLSRDVHPDDEIRLHQWRKEQKQTQGSAGEWV